MDAAVIYLREFDLQGLLATVGAALVTAEPLGYLILGIIFVFFLRGLVGLWHVDSTRRSLAEELQAHRRVLDAYAASDRGADDAEEAAAPGGAARSNVEPEERWAGLEAYVRRVGAEGHPGRILALVFQHRRLASPDVAAVIAAVRAYEWTDLERQRRTPNLLLLLGLAGTVVGLAAAVESIDVEALASGRTALDSFDVVLSQMPTAFVTTIWGILTALFFGALVGRSEAQTAASIRELEYVASAEWIPVLWPPGVEVQYEDLRKAMRSTNAVVTRTRQLMEKMTASFADTLAESSSAMGQHVADLAAVSIDTREAFKSLSTEVAQTVAALDRGSQEMRGATERLQAFHGEMQSAYARMDDLFRSAQAETREQVQETLDATRAQQRQFADATDRTMLSIDAVSRHLTGLADRIDAQADQLETVRSTTLTALSDGFRGMGARVAGALEPAIDRLGGAADKLEAPVTAFHGLIERSVVGSEAMLALKGVDALVATLSEETRQLEATTRRLLDEGPVVQALAQIGAAVDVLPQVLARLEAETAGRAEVLMEENLPLETPLVDEPPLPSRFTAPTVPAVEPVDAFREFERIEMPPIDHQQVMGRAPEDTVVWPEMESMEEAGQPTFEPDEAILPSEPTHRDRRWFWPMGRRRPEHEGSE